MMIDGSLPVITIDGPTASGKGTIAKIVANTLNFHLLDSGALYRLVALESLEKELDEQDELAHFELARSLQAQFIGDQVFLGHHEVGELIRAEKVGNRASIIASFPSVREALVSLQRSFAKPPGLVADGRDMGGVIFPNAVLKIFLTASAKVRAERRFKQLKEKGFCVNMHDLLHDLEARDARDRNRLVAPLMPAPEARILDTSALSIEQTAEQILSWYQEIAV